MQQFCNNVEPSSAFKWSLVRVWLQLLYIFIVDVEYTSHFYACCLRKNLANLWVLPYSKLLLKCWKFCYSTYRGGLPQGGILTRKSLKEIIQKLEKKFESASWKWWNFKDSLHEAQPRKINFLLGKTLTILAFKVWNEFSIESKKNTKTKLYACRTLCGDSQRSEKIIIYLQFGLDFPELSPGEDLNVRRNLLSRPRFPRAQFYVPSYQLVATWKIKAIKKFRQQRMTKSGGTDEDRSWILELCLNFGCKFLEKDDDAGSPKTAFLTCSFIILQHLTGDPNDYLCNWLLIRNNHWN